MRSELQYAEVFKSRTGWNVRYTSEPMKSEIIGLFDTNELPLPYGVAMSQSEVMREVRRNHNLHGTRPMAFVEAAEVTA